MLLSASQRCLFYWQSRGQFLESSQAIIVWSQYKIVNLRCIFLKCSKCGNILLVAYWRL